MSTGFIRRQKIEADPMSTKLMRRQKMEGNLVLTGLIDVNRMWCALCVYSLFQLFCCHLIDSRAFMMTEIQFILNYTSRGKTAVICEGFAYIKDKNLADEKVRYKCIHANSCGLHQ